MLRAFIAAQLTVVAAFSLAHAADSSGPIYELRTYVCEPGKLEALHERFELHTIQLFEKHGIKNIAYWTPSDGEAAKNTLIYLLEHESREAAQTSWEQFRNDPEWKAVAAASKEAHGKILAQRPDSVYLTLTDYSPQVLPPRAGKTYELRVYVTGEGKLAALHSRFRDHTDQLFKKHGMRALAYWKPQTEPKSLDTMYYILETDSREAAKAGWKGFSQDPDWQAAYKASTVNGKLLAERPTSIYMHCTTFSPVMKNDSAAK